MRGVLLTLCFFSISYGCQARLFPYQHQGSSRRLHQSLDLTKTSFSFGATSGTSVPVSPLPVPVPTPAPAPTPTPIPAPTPVPGGPPFLLDEAEIAAIPASPQRSECVSPLTALSAIPELSVLVSGITACGLGSDLSFSSWAGTILAPGNSAFGTFLAQNSLTQATLLQNTDILCPLLRNHILPGVALTAADLIPGNEYGTLNPGQTLTVSGNPADAIVLRDIPACNAFAHIMDIVLVEGGATATAQSTTPTSSGTPTTPTGTAATTTTALDSPTTTTIGGSASLDYTNVNFSSSGR